MTQLIESEITILVDEGEPGEFTANYVYTATTVGKGSNEYNTVSELYDLLIRDGYKAELIKPAIITNGSDININIEKTESKPISTIEGSTSTDVILVESNITSMVEKVPSMRYGNRSKVRMELRYGKDDSVFQLSKVYIDYLKAPAFIRLTQEQVDNVTDNSQLLEFPDYVCQEITNELIRLLMENGSDPRLQTNIPINQSIANPGQEQPQQKR